MRFFSRQVIGVILLLVGTSGVAQAGINIWTSNGPEGGEIKDLVVDPVNASIVYAGTQGGVFKSTDRGVSWSLVNTGLTDPSILALAVAPQTPTTLYVGTPTVGVFKSTDGVTWSATTTGLARGNVHALAIDPVTPSTLYAGVFGSGVFKSTDSGATWNAANTGLTNPGDREILALAVDPQTPTTVYAGTRGGGVFKSMDGGGTWSPANTGLTSTRVVTLLAVDPGIGPTAVYAGVGGTFRSTDGGDNWQALTVPSANILAVDPTSATTIYAGTQSGVFKSTDGGDTWAGSDAGLSITRVVSALAVDTESPTTLYAGTGGAGVYRSTDGGSTWSTSNTGLTATSVKSLAVDPVTPTTVYAGVNVMGVFKSTDGGGSWTAINTGLRTPGVFEALAIDPTTPTTLYVGTGAGAHKSTEGGATWSPTELTHRVFDFAINPVTPTTLYAATSRGVFRSTDGGVTWSAVNTGLPTGMSILDSILAVAIDPLTPTTLYAGHFTKGVFKTTDGGASWAAVNTGLPEGNRRVNGLVVDPATPSTLYAEVAGVFKSMDGGRSWSAIETDPAVFGPLAIDPRTPDTLYAGSEVGISKSTDGGGTWSPLSPALPDNIGITTLVIDPLTSTHLFGGTFGRGVFALQQVVIETTLVAAVLPSSRSVQVRMPATVFGTIINAGSSAATDVGISLNTSIPVDFLYQTTDPATNAIIGTANTPVDIPAGGSQSFVIALTPTAAVDPTLVEFTFSGTNALPVSTIPGVNTLLFSASESPIPDIVALAATLNNDGIVNLASTGVFAVATVNVGAGGTITASADTGGATLPVNIALCETNPATGICLDGLFPPSTTSVTTQIDANETPTFGIFVEGTGTVPFDPATNRIFVRFRDSGGVTRGATSVAVRTP